MPVPDEPVDVDTLDSSDPRHPDWDGFTDADLAAAAQAPPVPDGAGEHDRTPPVEAD